MKTINDLDPYSDAELLINTLSKHQSDERKRKKSARRKATIALQKEQEIMAKQAMGVLSDVAADEMDSPNLASEDLELALQHYLIYKKTGKVNMDEIVEALEDGARLTPEMIIRFKRDIGSENSYEMKTIISRLKALGARSALRLFGERKKKNYHFQSIDFASMEEVSPEVAQIFGEHLNVDKFKMGIKHSSPQVAASLARIYAHELQLGVESLDPETAAIFAQFQGMYIDDNRLPGLLSFPNLKEVDIELIKQFENFKGRLALRITDLTVKMARLMSTLNVTHITLLETEDFTEEAIKEFHDFEGAVEMPNLSEKAVKKVLALYGPCGGIFSLKTKTFRWKYQLNLPGIFSDDPR